MELGPQDRRVGFMPTKAHHKNHSKIDYAWMISSPLVSLDGGWMAMVGMKPTLRWNRDFQRASRVESAPRDSTKVFFDAHHS
jgi:hypothetical protein